MKSCSNSSNKAEKQMFEVKTVIEIKLWTCGLWPLFTKLCYKSTGKLIKKMTKIRNPIIFFKTIFFKSHNRIKFSPDSDDLNCNNTRSTLVNKETKSRPHKITADLQRNQNFKQFSWSHCVRHYKLKLLPSRTVYFHLLLILTLKCLLSKKIT